MEDPKTEDIGKLYVEMTINDEEYKVPYGIQMHENGFTCGKPTKVRCLDPNASEYQDEAREGYNPYPWADFGKDGLGPMDRWCDTSACFGSSIFFELSLSEMYFQIEKHIMNKMDECLDFSGFEEKGFVIRNDPATMQVEVNTFNQTVIAVMDYPFEIIDPTGQKTIELEHFYSDTQVRLQQLYTLSKYLVLQDINDPYFNITRDSSGISPNIQVKVIRNSDANVELLPAEDNVVQIRDISSEIPFTFQFARKNRPPVLGYIEDISKNGMLSNTYLETNNLLKYADPDEDEVIVKYYTGSPDSSKIDFRLNTCDKTFTVCISDDKTVHLPCNIADYSRDWQLVNYNCLTGPTPIP